jgi:hypothetical protein
MKELRSVWNALHVLTMAPLENAAHEVFAQRCAEGMSGAAAYRSAVSSTCKADSAIQQASRLLADVKVRSRVEELRKQANDILRDRLGVTKETLLAYYLEIMETAPGDIDAQHRLAQEVTDTEYGKRVKMPSKLEAAKQIALLSGWHAAEKVEIAAKDDLLDFLARIRKPGIPREPSRIVPGESKQGE